MVQISKAKKKKSWFIKDKKQKIREEVNKLLSVSFIRQVDCSEWLLNIMMVKTKLIANGGYI